MKLINDVSAQFEIRKHTSMLNASRFCIMDLLDLPFILITGRNKHGDLITVGELVNSLEFYQGMLKTCVDFLGEDNLLTQVIRMSTFQVKVFEKEIEDNLTSNHSLVFDCFNINKKPNSIIGLTLLLLEFAKYLMELNGGVDYE